MVSTEKRHINFDWVIIAAMFLLLPVDMVNGILLKGGIIFPVSIGQVFKLFILLLITARLLVHPKEDFLLLGVVFVLFLIPTVIQYFKNPDYNFRIVFDDIIKISKYLSIFLALIYFSRVFKYPNRVTARLFRNWILFSYGLFAFNILLKYAGLGFPFYEYDNTGTTGYFYAGNEISALLLVLYAIIGYHLYEIKKAKTHFFFFFIFNLFLGITITSKTAMLGIVLVTVLIFANPANLNRISLRSLGIWIGSVVLLVPLTAYFAFKLLKDSLILERMKYFYKKWDFVTFVFSQRNVRVEKMLPIYQEEWTFSEKLIGGGQYFYENRLGNVIEIDFFDIFFAYGITGAFLFLAVLFFLFLKAYVQYKNRFPYGRLALLMLFVLVLESSIAGHVFNSGIAGIFIGACIGMMFFKIPGKQENLKKQ